jgi:hypothetical protein
MHGEHAVETSGAGAFDMKLEIVTFLSRTSIVPRASTAA